MKIGPATAAAKHAVRDVLLAAFPGGEGESVAKLAIELLKDESTPPTLSLVAETESAVVGYVAFSPVSFGPDERAQGYILAPLGVAPGHQKHRIGSRLVESGKQQLTKMGAAILFVYGDPGYYGRFGFTAEAAAPYIPPYPLQYPFGWQAVVLNDGSARSSPARIACVPALCDPELW
mgnify:CR=1 FL=1